MKTSVETVEDSRVKLSVQIPASDFEKDVDEAFKKLAAEVKLPGFRPGKVPRRLLEQRLGTGVAREQALRDALPRYYAEAVVAEGVDAIAAPDIEITAGEEEGDVTFEAVVEVRPQVHIENYRGMRVVIPSPELTDDEVREQIDHLREQFADLEDSPTPLTDGDYAQIDLKGYVGEELVEGLSASDFLYEVGSEMLLPKLDEELRGQKPGAILEFEETLPERFGERAGETVQFRVLVKEAKRKVLPELTDEWVQDASEFETVAELEADVRTRMSTIRRVQAQIGLRDKLLEQLADLVTDEAPEPLVNEETQRRLHDLLHRLEARGATIEQYMEANGLSQQEFVARVQDGAARAVKADLALRAVVEQENVEVSDAELDEEIARLAERVERTPDEVRAELEHGGGLQAVRSEVARGKALQLVVDHAVVVDDAGNEIDLSLPEGSPAEAAAGDDEAGDTDEGNATSE
ncbi:MAG TPA: trigger factor [Acidimicrobiia bacterium]|nr:trigger factor [Acidimicrobiia bacterium]